MWVITLLKKLLNVIRLLVTGVDFTDKGLVTDVCPRWREAKEARGDAPELLIALQFLQKEAEPGSAPRCAIRYFDV